MKFLMAALLLGSATPVFLAGASPARADAAQSFREGKWANVIAQGRAEATGPSLLLAGRAQLAIAGYGTKDKAQALALSKLAEGDFDASLARAPGNPETQVQKGVAIGYQAKLTRSPGLGKEARRRFEAVRSAHPQVALAWAAVAGWHGGAIATLGGFLAGTLLGARTGEIDKGFAQAIKLEPNNPVHRTYYALILLQVDKANAAKAAAALVGVGQLPAKDGYEAMARMQGLQLAAALKAGDARAAQTLARRLEAFGDLS